MMGQKQGVQLVNAFTSVLRVTAIFHHSILPIFLSRACTAAEHDVSSGISLWGSPDNHFDSSVPGLGDLVFGMHQGH
jgi:hypothetical protein